MVIPRGTHVNADDDTQRDIQMVDCVSVSGLSLDGTKTCGT